ncbi:MAG: HD domain-containing protein [Candidatus Gracilibacteria bacterium]
MGTEGQPQQKEWDIDMELPQLVEIILEEIRQNPELVEKTNQGEKLGKTDFQDLKKFSHELVFAAIETRQKLGFPPPNKDHIVMFLYELAYTAKLYKDDEIGLRKNGDKAFDSHVIGVLRNLIKENHVTGLTTLLTAMKHDVTEDILRTGEEDKLFCTHLYIKQLKELPGTAIKQIMENVRKKVEAVTKVTGLGNKEAERAETFIKLLEATMEDIRVAMVKVGGDRRHNMSTITGHTEEGQIRIAEETAAIYLRLAQVMKIYITENGLLKDCLKVLNPQFLKEFEEAVESEMEKGQNLGSNIQRLLRKDKGLKKIVNTSTIELEPIYLSRLLHEKGMIGKTEGLKSLTPADLGLDQRIDPLTQIRIIVKNKNDLTKIEAALNEASTTFSKQKLTLNRGTIIRLRIPELRPETIIIRINDIQSEYHSHRGILAYSDNTNPQDIRNRIARVLQTVNERDERGERKYNVFDVVDEIFLQEMISVYTPEGDRLELPRGSTALDFADKIHRDILTGAQRAFLLTERGKEEISLFKPLPFGAIVEIESCLAKKDSDPSRVKVDRRWLLFCRTQEARSTLSAYLKDKDPESPEKHMQDLAELFDTTVEKLALLIKKLIAPLNAYQRSDQEGFWKTLYQGISERKIKIIELISFYLDQKSQRKPTSIDKLKKTLGFNLKSESNEETKIHQKFTVTLPDESEILEYFLSDFRKGLGINLDSFHQEEKTESGVPITFEVSYPHEAITTYDFLKILVRLQLEGYDIKFKLP